MSAVDFVFCCSVYLKGIITILNLLTLKLYSLPAEGNGIYCCGSSLYLGFYNAPRAKLQHQGVNTFDLTLIHGAVYMVKSLLWC